MLYNLYKGEEGLKKTNKFVCNYVNATLILNAFDKYIFENVVWCIKNDFTCMIFQSVLYNPI